MSKSKELEEKDPLQKQFQSLEEDWKSYKKSITRDCRSHSVLSLELLNTSPKKLISSLQQCNSPRAKTNNIKGRSLLEELENVKDDIVSNEASPICSICSSVLSEEKGKGSDSGLSYRVSGSSDSSLGSNREEKINEKKSGEDKWVMRMIWLFVTIWIVALGIFLAMTGFEAKYGEYVTPT